ncbi:uncharacterized protein LOC111675925 [Lucilia cuprina]|uniref:uncharacterized protein LOC111675925 n=1 Tax=Lucilia cuprina TaxID=7375 RepID=UPI001F060428|nr:uncharacterized protein LOC111675925 [Lucilia cuprina]XP_046809624.1 uncharacterized protein LOC111675925 [Lucilia cuprina]XP_046809625.1 uncharacterized protein LOC111675925 [Lucilia cuprina]XP_046809626.1 uncharacterized protein LOC111675925 [Lucilia cuprina]XP_046809628.1 uncharacterized protein LOC111675925 [Lucilia cuprina]XP_046809629.1 uncharacterized protein LOC111675925 [Lucilia cuprina]
MSNREQPPPATDDKGSEAGAGCISSQDFRQNHSTQRPPMPHELTAEWTVSAQLKFARAGETVKKEFSTNDTVNPVRVFYKWNKIDDNTTAGGTQYEDDKTSDLFKRTSSRSSARSQDPVKKTNSSELQKGESFRSTTSSMTCGDVGGGDSAFSGSNTSNKPQNDSLTTEVKDSLTNFYGTRCRSTCNIIVTAVADFLSPTDMQTIDNMSVENTEMDMKPFVFNTTASYTVQPEKFFDQASYSERAKQLNLRDAVCQTSDTEMKYFVQHERKRSPLERRDSRRSYDYRRATVDDLLQQPGFRGRISEEHSHMPSYIPSPTQTSKSSSLPRVSSLMGGDAENKINENCFPEKPSHSDTQKKPRTVHIDVYCTGSEDDDQADAESSSDSEDDKRLDQESNSTFQTVLDNEQMRLRHQRITGNSLPRRLADNNATKLPKQKSDSSQNINIGHAITKSSTAEEIHESKQLLFRKHVGDQRAVKLQNLRQKYLRQSSDDTLSLGYPNSSRSTVRDNTCSSISSILAGQDVTETSCKETDELEDLSYSLAKSDSFEYENALDRLRIRQMERLWSRSHSNEDESKVHQPGGSHLQSISEVTTFQRKSPCPLVVNQQDTLPTQMEIVSETDQNSSYSNETFNRSSPVNVSNYKFQQTSHFPRNKPGFLQFFGPHLEQPQTFNVDMLSQQQQSIPELQNKESTLLYPNYGAGLQRWKSETRDNLSASGTPVLTPTVLSRQTSPQPPLPHQTPPPYNINFQRSGSEAPPSTTSAITFPITTPTPARRFDMYNRPSPAISEASTQPPPLGYSSEYLDKAKMFGKVVAARKPGHHVGPTKNPNCSCESCQRWLAERFQIRGRVFSLGEMPVLKRAT